MLDINSLRKTCEQLLLADGRSLLASEVIEFVLKGGAGGCFFVPLSIFPILLLLRPGVGTLEEELRAGVGEAT